MVVTGEVVEEGGSEAVGSLLPEIRTSPGEVVDQIVVRDRDAARVRAGVSETQHSALPVSVWLT